MNIGKSIRLCRQQKHWSQSELASKAEISVSYLSLLERNLRDPNISILTKLADSLSVPLSVLVFLSADKSELELLDSEVAEKLSWVTYKLIQDMDSDEEAEIQA